MTDKNKQVGFLQRLFRKKPNNSLLAELNGRAFNKPLFINADLGSQIIRAYLNTPQMSEDANDDEMTISKTGSTAVLDISGALLSRPIGFCSPLSYEEITGSIANSLADSSVRAIVLRLDSAGGEASQNIDLADFIYNNRGNKPIIAMIDDMAYSAAYAIAAACDQIWVTRTSGVGSVGVVAYHLDQSELNTKIGVKVEYIHAGDRKVDFNSNSPLSTEARANLQSEVSRLYSMFVNSVAKNRGMSAEAVIATQAGTFHGEEGIAVGFADKLGTFSDLINFINSAEFDAEQVMKHEPKQKEKDEEKEPDVVEDKKDKKKDKDKEEPDKDVVEDKKDKKKDKDKEEPDKEADEEDEEEGEDEEEEKDKKSKKKQQQKEAAINAICITAGVKDAAASYIQSDMSLNQVREEVLSLTSLNNDVEVHSFQNTVAAATNNPTSVADAHARHNKKR